MIFEQNTGLEGLYRLVKRKVTTDEVVHDTGWFHNLITDTGLDLFGESSLPFVDYISVGTGNSIPAFTDTGLANRKFTRQANSTGFSRNTGELATYGVLAGGPPYVSFYRCKARFEAGEATGNITEVGIGPVNTGLQLFSRSLVVDGVGSPVAITVLADEYLDVYYELRGYYKETDSVANITISGVSYNVVWRRHSATSSLNGLSLGYNAGSLVTTGGGYTFRPTYLHDSTGELGPITGTPTGPGDNPTTTFSALAYTLGSHFRDISHTWGPTAGNFATGIGVISVSTSRGFWQMKFTPAIPKNATNSLNIVVRVRWERYTP